MMIDLAPDPGCLRHAGSAAQYVRMSTDKQKYSIQNQSRVIAEYAEKRGLVIVRNFEDAGRSGLKIIGRDGLKALIDLVKSGSADFDHVLVYDVSRWGRFQDIDESAYYEFICRRAGIKLHYCSDEFENDGSLASTILKNVKRLMAADYSRQLSGRVFLAQCRMTELGLWRGGAAAYGLRRQLVDPHGIPIKSLERGQRKSMSSERVVLMPGPPSEIEIVRGIFDSLVLRQKTYSDIAADLNKGGILNARGAAWSPQTVINVLTNEAYIGNVVYNRTSFKLREKIVANPQSMWIRRNNAHKGLIPPELFARAQAIIAKFKEGLSDQELLNKLAILWRQKGSLSHRIVQTAKDVPHPCVYEKRFGSLRRAFELIGFELRRTYHWVETDPAINALLESEIAKIVATIENSGFGAAFASKSRMLTIESALKVAIGSARCEHNRPQRWTVKVNRREASHLTLIFKIEPSNTAVSEYYVIRSVELATVQTGRLRLSHPAFRKASRCNSLTAFYEFCAEQVAKTCLSSHLAKNQEAPKRSSQVTPADTIANRTPPRKNGRPRAALTDRK